METPYEHITLNEHRVPEIAGTTMKVVELVVEQQAHGWSPEELHFQHPYLTLGQFRSALAYCWDHREELDLDIRRRLERVEELRGELQHPELAALLFASEQRSQSMKYRVLIVQDEDGVYVAEVPSLPGCISQGQNREVAVENIREAIAGYLESMEAHGDPIPSPITEEVVEVHL